MLIVVIDFLTATSNYKMLGNKSTMAGVSTVSTEGMLL